MLYYLILISSFKCWKLISESIKKLYWVFLFSGSSTNGLRDKVVPDSRILTNGVQLPSSGIERGGLV
jgi:hypothetical protein